MTVECCPSCDGTGIAVVRWQTKVSRGLCMCRSGGTHWNGPNPPAERMAEIRAREKARAQSPS